MDVHDLLRECREQFAAYTRAHIEKANAHLSRKHFEAAIESLEKAQTNQKFVDLIDAALPTVPSEEPDTPGPYDVI